MKANLLLLAALLLAHSASAQVPAPGGTNRLSHDEMLRMVAARRMAATNAAAANVPDWSVTNSPRPASASASTQPATVAQVDPATATRVAAALTNARPATPRPVRTANLPPPGTSAPETPAAVPAPIATTPPPVVMPPPSGNPASMGEMSLRAPSTANTVSEPNRVYPAGTIDFPAASLEQILTIYSELVGRNLLRPTSLNMKQDIVLKQTTPLTKLEVVQMIEAALYLNQVSVINVGEKFVTVMPTAEAFKIPGIISTNSAEGLSDLGTIITRIVQLKYVKPSEMQTVLTPFVSGTAPNPIFPVDSSGILVLRDNVANVKRMLEMIEKIDIVAESEIISEVIPIKYAKAEEIASALSSVGGGSGGTVGTRASSSSTTGAGLNRPGMLGQQSNPYGQPNTGAVPGATPTPSSGASFGDRVRNLITKASQSGDLTLLGNTKIIADIRSNSLLVFATRRDLEMIKDIISKLDVVLAQVLIETIILDVSFGNDWSLGVSAGQAPRTKGDIKSGGFANNPKGSPLSTLNDFLKQSSTTNLNGIFPGGDGLNYFGRFGGDLDVAISAIASDSRVNVIQKPRVQTSHATPASIFIGQTVPYISGTYNGYGANGVSSSYQQLRVGIGLNVTPFINQDGLVVMKIEETIDEIGETVQIDGNDVPKTKSSTLTAEIAVRDRETIVLGGIIKNSDSKSKSGVPLLKDIPLLGALFSSSSSSKSRSELVVLMRPTVLRTPEEAALQVEVEKQRLPGIREAEKDLDKVELQNAERDKRRRSDSSRNKKATSNPQARNEFHESTPFSPEEEKLFLTSPTATP